MVRDWKNVVFEGLSVKRKRLDARSFAQGRDIVMQYTFLGWRYHMEQEEPRVIFHPASAQYMNASGL